MSSDSRSWTDAVTNEVLLKGLNGTAYIKWFQKRQVRIEDAIPSFLHEFTHHWCFDSGVGRALALVRMRIRYSLLIRETDDIEVDLATYETARRMLKPFSEGLALFAEFDLAPGNSAMMSNTLQALKMCFNFPLEGKGSEAGHERATQALLQNTRMRTAFIRERKARLYAKPFDLNGDVYLAGYLAIKNLWMRFSTKVDMDRDLFLSYMRMYLFEDPILARLLFEPTAESGILASQAVARRIHTRFASLIESLENSPEKARNFAALVDRHEPVTTLMATIDCSDNDYTLSSNAFEQHLAEFRSDLPQGDETADILASLCVFSAICRSEMVVASAPVRLLYNGQAWQAVLPDGQSLPLKHASGLVNSDDATYAIVMARSGLCLFEGVLAAGVWVLQGAHGLADEASAEAVEVMMMSRQFTRETFDLMEQGTNELIEESWLKIILAKVQSNVDKWNTDVYLSLSTLIVQDNRVAEVKNLIKDFGVRKFVYSERNAIALAAISIGNTVACNTEMLIHFFGRRAGLEPEAMQAAMADLQNQKLYPLLMGDESYVYGIV